MKNEYLTIEEYLEYVKIFNLSSSDTQKLNYVIAKIKRIIELQNETPQKNKREKYLRFLMFPADYTRINKDLHIQLKFKLNREIEKYRKQLNLEIKYTEEEKEEKIDEFKEELCKELKIRNVENEEEGEILTFANFDNIKGE